MCHSEPVFFNSAAGAILQDILFCWEGVKRKGVTEIEKPFMSFHKVSISYISHQFSFLFNPQLFPIPHRQMTMGNQYYAFQYPNNGCTISIIFYPCGGRCLTAHYLNQHKVQLCECACGESVLMIVS